MDSLVDCILYIYIYIYIYTALASIVCCTRHCTPQYAVYPPQSIQYFIHTLQDMSDNHTMSLCCLVVHPSTYAFFVSVSNKGLFMGHTQREGHSFTVTQDTGQSHMTSPLHPDTVRGGVTDIYIYIYKCRCHV